MISKEAALALTEELISSWVKFNDNLATVCREEAWKPLGFRNLPAYLSHYYPGADISIISSRVEIIWSSDDATEDEIIDCVEHGITRAAIRNIRAQKALGVPKEKADPNLKTTVKKKADPAGAMTLFLSFVSSPDIWRRIGEVAGPRDTDRKRWAIRVLTAELDRVDRERDR